MGAIVPHDVNIKNRTIFCRDNLDILQNVNSGTIGLIYLDPPFNKKKIFTAPIGSSAEGASFSDIFRQEDVKEEWLQEIKEDYYAVHDLLNAVRTIEGRQSYNFCYLAYMAIRLIECYRILQNMGSLYLHCDPTMSHYLKILLDSIFGEKHFRNEIVWAYSGPSSGKITHYPKKHDIILYYTKGNAIFNKDAVRIPYRALNTDKGKLSKIWGNKGVLQDKKTRQKYLLRGKIPFDWWDDIPSGGHISPKERLGYPTQKPLSLLERIISASSNIGDMVLDPFCGCATTCVAAEKLNREWVGIDVSQKAYELVQKRMKKEVEWEGSIFAEDLVAFSTTPPARTDGGQKSQGQQKYVYVISNKQYGGEWKIGIASDTKKRLASYQTSDPNRGYVLEYELLTPHFREIEAFIHSKYESRHEWVQGDLDAIKKSIKNWQPPESKQKPSKNKQNK